MDVPNRVPGADGSEGDPLALEREVQELRLELEDARSEIEALQEALDRRRTQESSRVSDTVSTMQHELMSQVAAPVAQLLTQAYMIEKEGRTLNARDVLAVSKRIVSSLRDAGLTLAGEVGQMVAFDGDRHEPLGDVVLEPGEPVVVRMVGVSFQGQVLRRVGVARGS